MQNQPSKFRSKMMRVLFSGTLLFSFFGSFVPQCDQNAQAVVVQGLEDATVALIRGLFEQVVPFDEDAGDGGTVPSV